MIFSRRALQWRLTQLRAVFDPDTADGLVQRLNVPGKKLLGAVWETVVLHALSECGTVRNEVPLPSGRRPDIAFQVRGLSFTADIRSVSDDGLEQSNPYRELAAILEEAKKKLRLPIGGMDLVVHSRREEARGGTRTLLKLPPRAQLRHFVTDRIVPVLREQMGRGETVLRVEIDDGQNGFEITIDPKKSPYSSGSFAAYDLPRIKDRNPLFSALKDKADQLRGAPGLTGIIVGDGGCGAISSQSTRPGEMTAEPIIADFFRQYSSVGFVLVLGVSEIKKDWFTPTLYQNQARLFVQEGLADREALQSLFTKMRSHFPEPQMTPVNGAHRAREDGYGRGYHGGYTLSGKTITIGLRELTEILAGLRTLGENDEKAAAEARQKGIDPDPVGSAVRRHLAEGRLPVSIELIKAGESDDDDAVKVEFGDADPAIAPFR